jgi:PAS domain S-box-containing protein
VSRAPSESFEQSSHMISFPLGSTEEQLHVFKSMSDNVSDFIGMCDLNFKPFYLNKSGLRKVGLDENTSIESIDVKDFFFVEDQDRIFNEFYPIVKEKGFGEIEVRFRHFVTGEGIWMLYSVIILENLKGERVGYGTISRDITKEKRTEEAIAESEERFRNLADHAPMFIWMVDEHAKITYANKELLEFLDIPDYNEVAVQGGWERVTHPEDIQNVFQAYLNALTNKTEYSVEARLFHAEKNQYEWFLFKGTPRYVAGHTFAGFIGTAVSINQQKLLLEAQENLVGERTRELMTANNLLARSNQELEQFAYITSHDLQEPLRKIQTFAHLIDERYHKTLSDEAQNFLQKINRAAGRMSELVKDLLDLSKLAYDNRFYFQSTDLNDLLSNVLSDLELLIAEKEIRIERDDLPTIEVIPVQVRQLFYNLMGNAVKFSRPGVQSFIRIKSRPLTKPDLKNYQVRDEGLEYILITIEDNGIGFSPEYSEQIFTVFQRLNDKTVYSGHGIGLALCRKIVDNHGGVIFATGKEDAGAVFSIVLPTGRE